MRIVKLDTGDENDKPRTHIVISPTVFALLLSAVGFGGAGTFGVANKALEIPALEMCINNSADALHRIDELERKVRANKEYIDSRTANRWTSEDQERFERQINYKINQLESECSKISRKIESHDYIDNYLNNSRDGNNDRGVR